jgi:hypothetical protein
MRDRRAQARPKECRAAEQCRGSVPQFLDYGTGMPGIVVV